MAQTWLNPDGLYIKYGVTKTTPNLAGEYRNNGKLREIELTISLSSLTEVEVVQSDQVFVPSGARLVEVEILTHTAAATGTAIDLGLVRTDRTTAIDADGLLIAFVTASMGTAGETSVIRRDVTIPTGLAGTGALLGTTTSNVGYITASRTDATAFTAGLITVRIRYYMP